MFKVKKQHGAAGAAVAIILVLCGLVTTVLTYKTGLTASDAGIEGTYNAYEEITGEEMSRPNQAPVGAYPVPGQGGEFEKYFFDNFYYENGTKDRIEGSYMDAVVQVKQTEKKKNSYEVVLQFDSIADLSRVQITPDSAVVLVVDTSGSMKYDMDGYGYCIEPTCSSYGKRSNSHNWKHRWAINPKTGENTSRFYYAAQALESFLDNFADGSDGRRLLSIVYFGESGEYIQDWVDVNTEEGFNTAQAHLTYDAISANPRLWTSQGTGLEMAKEMLRDEDIDGVAHKYVLLVTDGRPEDVPKGVTGASQKTNENGTYAERVATELENEFDVSIMCMGFSTVGVKMKQGDKYVNDWLKNDIATSPEDCFFSNNANDLTLGLDKLQQEIANGATLFTVNATLNSNVILSKVLSDEEVYSLKGRTIIWNLRDDVPEVHTHDDGTKTYSYILKSIVSLDTDKKGFSYGMYYKVFDEVKISVIALTEEGKIVEDANIEIKHLSSPEIYAAESPN